MVIISDVMVVIVVSVVRSISVVSGGDRQDGAVVGANQLGLAAVRISVI